MVIFTSLPKHPPSYGQFRVRALEMQLQAREDARKIRNHCSPERLHTNLQSGTFRF